MMDLILFSASVFSTIIWLVFFLMPIRWRMSEQWEASDRLHTTISQWPSLSVIVPARNESESLLLTLLDTHGLWARLLVPAFVYFFHVLYPFEMVQNLLSKESAAVGGCILVSRQALDKIGGIAGYCNAWIDDIALARKIKGAGMSLSLSLTKSVVSVRPYRRLLDIWDMVARNAFAQLQHSWLALVGTVLGLVILFIIPVTGICTFMAVTTSQVTILFSSLSLFVMALTYVPTLRLFSLSVWRAFTLPVAGGILSRYDSVLCY